MLETVVVTECEASELTKEVLVRGFAESGLFIIRNALSPEELHRLRCDTQEMVEEAVTNPMSEKDIDAQRPDPRDICYGRHYITGEITPFRVNSLLDKSESVRHLFAHPLILQTVHDILGDNFLPTWDSMVFKTPGVGAEIPWHRDEQIDDYAHHNFNVDIYLDDSDEENCVWGIPGSHLWPRAQAEQKVQELNSGGFQRNGAVPVVMYAGDILLHDIHTLHGSAPTQGPLRRVIYFEYRHHDYNKQFHRWNDAFEIGRRSLITRCHDLRAAAYEDEQAFLWNGPNDGASHYKYETSQYEQPTWKGHK